MGPVLTAQCPTADRNARPIIVHRKLAPGLAVVAIASGSEQGAIGVDEQINLTKGGGPSRIARLERFVDRFKISHDQAEQLHEIGIALLLQRDEDMLDMEFCALLAHANEQLAVGAVPFERALAARGEQAIAQHQGKKMLGRHIAYLGVIARPADHDALVVDISRPRIGITLLAAKGGMDLVARGIDPIVGCQAD